MPFSTATWSVDIIINVCNTLRCGITPLENNMVVKVKKKGNQFCAVNEDGTELEAGCFDTEAEAVSLAKAANSNESDKKERREKYVPYNALTFEDIEAADEARDAAGKVSELTWNFQELMWNVMNSSEILDKPAAFRVLSGQYTDRLEVLTRVSIKSAGAQSAPAPDSSFLYVDGDKQYFQFKGADGEILPGALRDAVKGVCADDVDEDVKSAVAMTAKNILFAIGEEDTNPISKVIEAVKRAVGHQKERRDDVLIWKDQDGTYRWIARYSNNFRDDDRPVREIISGKSHE